MTAKTATTTRAAATTYRVMRDCCTSGNCFACTKITPFGTPIRIEQWRCGNRAKARTVAKAWAHLHATVETAKPIDLTPLVQPSTYAGETGHYKSDAMVVVAGYHSRFGIGGWDETAKGRIKDGGPMVQGPHLYCYGLASVIAANPMDGTYGDIQRAKAAGLWVELKVGDRVTVRGDVFEVQPHAWNRDYFKFVLVPAPRRRRSK